MAGMEEEGPDDAGPSELLRGRGGGAFSGQ